MWVSIQQGGSTGDSFINRHPAWWDTKILIVPWNKQGQHVLFEVKTRDGHTVASNTSSRALGLKNPTTITNAASTTTSSSSSSSIEGSRAQDKSFFLISPEVQGGVAVIAGLEIRFLVSKEDQRTDCSEPVPPTAWFWRVSSHLRSSKIDQKHLRRFKTGASWSFQSTGTPAMTIQKTATSAFLLYLEPWGNDHQSLMCSEWCSEWCDNCVILCLISNTSKEKGRLLSKMRCVAISRSSELTLLGLGRKWRNGPMENSR